jgi:hypothetical protein
VSRLVDVLEEWEGCGEQKDPQHRESAQHVNHTPFMPGDEGLDATLQCGDRVHRPIPALPMFGFAPSKLDDRHVKELSTLGTVR